MKLDWVELTIYLVLFRSMSSTAMFYKFLERSLKVYDTGLTKKRFFYQSFIPSSQLSSEVCGEIIEIPFAAQVNAIICLGLFIVNRLNDENNGGW